MKCRINIFKTKEEFISSRDQCEMRPLALGTSEKTEEKNKSHIPNAN